MSRICKGDGECLQQHNEYYIKNLEIICNHSCIPIKCKNYILCGEQFPEMYIECWSGKGLCWGCHMSFGTLGKMPNGNIGKGILDISYNMVCPVCLENQTCISQPYCDHSLCIKCFKKCYGYDWEYDVKEPNFPYSEDIHDKYSEIFDNEDIVNFENEYPLIKIYNREWTKWNDLKDENYDILDKYVFKICPVCHITKEIKYNQMIENKEILKKSFKILKKQWLINKYKDTEIDIDDDNSDIELINGILCLKHENSKT